MGIWIIGAGKFGTMAVEKLSRGIPASRIRVIDSSADKLTPFRGEYPTIRAEASDWMMQSVEELEKDEVLIPAIPSHVAFDWIARKMSGRCTLQPMSPGAVLLDALPHPIPRGNGQILVSNAEFICPANCSEPSDVCTYTRSARPREMHKYLGGLSSSGFHPIVLESRQMAPGVGGYTVNMLSHAYSLVEGAPMGTDILFATACRCHGVINLFRLN